ncbi:hypothetical protein [Streptococcus sp. CSL10205-OR2]|uniref:hypothetical protein n=1 Tax=Streptococcus sp. CSL10205-OR2 TaxID=2980558 RepID=UPI0021DB1722|nr:hypothetical protein [Streptococcus sp. CSL10205-OR2]MCU9533648.1 hypothetical protein [Streptococcus sp. CSL10205-OR2]
MDKVNESFQRTLAKKQFFLKIIEKPSEWHYKGKFAVSEKHMIDFGVSITKGQSKGIGQIIYQNLAYCPDKESRLAWLEFINDLNRQLGIYYYFCLDEDGYVYMRHFRDVTTELEDFFNTIIQAPNLIRKVLVMFEERFGSRSVFK